MVGIAEIGIVFALLNVIGKTYSWARKVMSNKWKNELENHVKYLGAVEQEVTRYKNSKCSNCQTSIPDALKLLEESWSIVRKWKKKDSVCKRLRSDHFLKKLEKSQNTITRHLELIRNCRHEEGNPARPQTQQAVPQEGNPARPQTQQEKEREENEYKAWLKKNITKWTVIFFRIARLQVVMNYLKRRNDRMLQKKKEFEEQKKEKKREENEYKAWLKKNIRKSTDGWPSYKTVWEGATNSKLGLAERKRLFENHVDGLHEIYLRAYRQLLKEVITPDLAIEYLTSWSDAERLLLQHMRFGWLPKEERESEWCIYIDNLLKTF